MTKFKQYLQKSQILLTVIKQLTLSFHKFSGQCPLSSGINKNKSNANVAKYARRVNLRGKKCHNWQYKRVLPCLQGLTAMFSMWPWPMTPDPKIKSCPPLVIRSMCTKMVLAWRDQCISCLQGLTTMYRVWPWPLTNDLGNQ